MSDADIRDWLRDQGEAVPERGPLPKAARERYAAAHSAPDYPEGMSDADFDVSDPGAPPADVAEKKPRDIATPKGGALKWGGWRKPAAKARKPKPKRPRVPVDDLIASCWRGLAGFARPLPPTSRLLKIQAPVAGAILEDTVKGTVVDTWLQPVARMAAGGEALFALLGPPVLVTAIQLQPDSAPFILPVLRESLLSWCKVAGPKMAEAMKREMEFESEFGQNVDEMLAFLFSQPDDPDDPAAAMAAEEEAVRRAQQSLQDAVA